MNRDLLQQFAYRVTQANRTELVVITYEAILAEIASAREALAADDKIGFEKDLKNAQRFLGEMMGALDYQYPIALELLSIYLYINKSLITALMKRSAEPLDGIHEVIEKLLVAYKEVSKQDTSGPVMANTEQVYAGLTYAKGSLNEMYLDQNVSKRGFMV